MLQRTALSSFVGRKRELAGLRALLTSSPLLTLTGPGGVGKTRLALEAVAGEDAHLIELARVADGDRVASALLDGLGRAEVAGAAPLDAVAAALGSAETLLVLDNCEHVVDAAAEVVETLLRRCPRLRVLATSREPLGVPGETTWPVPPLSLEDDAVTLLVERARSVRPDFELTADGEAMARRVCAEADGLPLAIELAAARLRLFSLSEVADGLSDRLRLLTTGARTAPPHQRSLRASIDWSHSLLTETERTVFRRLAVCDGFDLAAAEAVCAAGDVLEPVAALADKSLLESRDGRLRMLGVIHEYARERLTEAGEEAAAADRHLAHFGALAGAHGADLPNLRAALDHAIATDPITAVELAARVAPFWVEHRRFREGAEACERALAAGAATAPPAAVAGALWGVSALSLQRLDLAHAIDAAHACLRAAEQTDDPWALGLAHHALGAAFGASAPRDGLAHADRAVAFLREAGDKARLCAALATLAMAHGYCNQMGDARTAAEECLELSRRLARPWPAAWAELALAWAAITDTHFTAALEHADRALAHEPLSGSVPHAIAVALRLHALVRSGRAEQARAEGIPEIDRTVREDAGLGLSSVRHAVALAELALGDLDAAAAWAALDVDDPVTQLAGDSRFVLAAAALARGDAVAAANAATSLRELAERTGVPRHLALADLAAGRAALLADDPAAARRSLYAALDTLAAVGMRHQVIDALEALAALLATAEPEVGARLLAAADADRKRSEGVRTPPDPEYWSALETQLRAAAPDAWAVGTTLTIDDAVAYALRGRGPRDRAPAGWGSLTPTEAEVAALCAEGLTNIEIGERLFMSRSTVKRHLSHAFEKIGVSSRAELAAAAARQS